MWSRASREKYRLQELGKVFASEKCQVTEHFVKSRNKELCEV